MLDYCTRFYERQFITRENKNKTVLEELETLLDDYIASGRLQGALLPTSEYCATGLGLSVPYFNDLLKFETGKTLDEYFQLRRLKRLKGCCSKRKTPGRRSTAVRLYQCAIFQSVIQKNYGHRSNEYRYSN